VLQIHESHHEDSHDGHELHCKHYSGSELVYDAGTRWSDHFNRKYAEHMSATGLWRLEYEVVSECAFLHGNPLENALGQPYVPTPQQAAAGEKLGEDTFAPKSVRSFSNFMSVVEPELFVQKPRWLEDNMEEGDVLDLLLDEEKGAGGFVVIHGGREKKDDLASKSMGFCMQKSSVRATELGEGAHKLAQEVVERELPPERIAAAGGLEAAGKEYLEKKCKDARYTMTRKHFEETICLPLSQFRWLVKERHLTDFSLLHVSRTPFGWPCRLTGQRSTRRSFITR
jgi:hypothetical protein